MIRSIHRTETGEKTEGLTPEAMAEALASGSGLLWLDIASEVAGASEPLLREVFGFHALAVEDALQESHVPKINDWGTYLYLVLHAVDFEGVGDLRAMELDVFVGANFLVTYRSDNIAAIDRLWERASGEGRYMEMGGARLLHRLVDMIVEDDFPVVDRMAELQGRLDERVFEAEGQGIQEQILALKRATLALRRVVLPQREVLNRLAREEYAVVPARLRVYFRDVYDHLVRMHDVIDATREQVGATLDTYMLAVSNRMNEVMKTLTLVTTFFMPITFVAGFFGMNFFQPRGPTDLWTGAAALAIVLGLMILMPAGMFLWARRRGWLG